LSGEVASRAAAAQPADAIAAADAASVAFPGWATLAPNARRKLLLNAAAKLRENGGEFAKRVSAETGSTVGWGHFNVHFAAMLLEEAAAMTTQITGEVVPSDYAGTLSMAIRQPAGVVLGMAPWNAPVILGVRSIAMPLACGNTVILKASEICPASSML
jgi:acyl-CoA reductase-like NAD-dependent aldehyde dehydrogenase